MPAPPEDQPFRVPPQLIDSGFGAPPRVRVLPFAGCFGILLVLFSLCIMPLFLIDAMRVALERLHLSPLGAVLAVCGILVGSVINIPVYHFSRSDVQVLTRPRMFGLPQYPSQFRQPVWETIVAVNVGGCIIPALLALWQILYLISFGGASLFAVVIASALNVVVCYLAARPVSGLGIMMPGLVSPLTAVLATWLLLGADDFDQIRASVAFVAGVLGPLIGADLLHLKDMKTREAVSMLTMGGAGSFDGIILSGIVAALFA